MTTSEVNACLFYLHLGSRIYFPFQRLNFVDTVGAFSTTTATAPLEMQVVVLDCDTISQVKEKIIDQASCRTNKVAYSQRKLADDFILGNCIP